MIYFENKLAKHKQEIFVRCVRIAMDELMPDVKDINISVIARRNLFNKHNIWGDCFWESDRDFVIRIDTSIPISDFIITVMHEMVHIKQHIFNEQFDYNLPYDERPHEIEAHTLERVLKGKYDEMYLQ